MDSWIRTFNCFETHCLHYHSRVRSIEEKETPNLKKIERQPNYNGTEKEVNFMSPGLTSHH